MNKILLFITFTLVFWVNNNYNYAQDRDAAEFYFYSENLIFGNQIYTFSTIPIGHSYYYFSGDQPIICTDCQDEQIDFFVTRNGSDQFWGWSLRYTVPVISADLPVLGNGIYLIKVSSTEDNYFYLNILDDRIACYNGSFFPTDSPDCKYIYDGLNTQTLSDDNFKFYEDMQTTSFREFNFGDVFEIWRGFTNESGNFYSTASTNLFPTDYWINSLALFEITSLEDYWIIGESPMILWGKEKDAENVTDYKLYRAFSPDRSVPSASDYFLINEGSTDLLYYKDNGIKYVGEPLQEDDGAVYYYVKSYSGGTYKNTTLVRNARYVKMNWENALLLDNYNNHPRLIWGPYPDGTVSGYKVYKTKSGTTQIAATVSAGTFNWIDYSEFIWTGTYRPVYVSYYVEPIISNPIATNTVTTKVNPWQSKETPPDENGSKSGFNYSLSDNYPNPSTTELYLIPSVDALSLSKC